MPLLVGVAPSPLTAEAIPATEGAVRELFADLRRRYPSTRIVLMSSLAEGIDRLVARQALSLGASLTVPLPAAPDAYQNEFASDQSRSEFRTLLAAADSSFVVAGAAACVGFIVRQCVDLIIFSADANADESFAPEQSAFDPSLSGPIVHAVGPRGVTVKYPRPAVSVPVKTYDQVKSEIDRFNFDATHGSLAERVCGQPIRRQAELLATAYQRRTARVQLAISAAAFLAIIAFNLYASIPAHPLALFFTYVVFTAAAFAPYLAYRRGEWQQRYEDYRAFEQVLRTGEYWAMAGIARTVAAELAKNERAKIDWIAIALRAVTEVPPPPNSTPAAGATSWRTIYEEWILGQYRYFTAIAGKRERNRERITSRLVTLFVALSVALTIGSRAGASFGWLSGSISPVLLGATILAVVAALVHDFADKRGWSEHSRHYDLMGALFGYAGEQIEPLLDRLGSDPAAATAIRAILTTLGEEAIRESAAWLNLHRSRPLNVPHV